MKYGIRLSAALLLLVMVAFCFGVYSKDRAEAASGPQESQKPAAAYQHPAANAGAQPASQDPFYGPSFDSLAWGLFLEAMAPTDHDALTVETWREECQLNPDAAGCPSAASVTAAEKAGGNGAIRLVHGSPAAEKMAGSDCSAMRTTPVGVYPAPSNLAPNAIFCEEVRVSPPEADFLKKSGLTTLMGQQAYGSAHSMAIDFPGTGMNEIRSDLDAVEVKLDWAPATSFTNPTFACPDPTNHLYTETINGTCYALVGIHITSKSMIRWFWATFEPNSTITNPNRCDPQLYGECLDDWGTTSSQPYAKGQMAQQSPQLQQAMAALHMNPALSNYFLTGVQTEFVADGKPTELGNSFVEFNQGVPPGKSSCITCHQYAAFDGKRPAQGEPENNYGRPPRGWPYIGYACNRNQNDNCTPAVRNSTTQDFSWMLGLMPYSSSGARQDADRPQTKPKNEPQPAPQATAPPPAPPVAQAAAASPAPPAPDWPVNQIPNEATVNWNSNGLEIEAANSSLDQILQQVAARTGARLEGVGQDSQIDQHIDQRIFGTYGPGPARDVLSKLLDGSGYNVLIVGGRDTDAPLEIVLTVSSPRNTQTVASNPNPSKPDDDDAADPPEPEQSAAPPMKTPFGNGDSGSPETPQQIMQDIVGRQQKIDQQQQQNHPQQ